MAVSGILKYLLFFSQIKKIITRNYKMLRVDGVLELFSLRWVDLHAAEEHKNYAVFLIEK